MGLSNYKNFDILRNSKYGINLISNSTADYVGTIFVDKNSKKEKDHEILKEKYIHKKNFTDNIFLNLNNSICNSKCNSDMLTKSPLTPEADKSLSLHENNSLFATKCQFETQSMIDKKIKLSILQLIKTNLDNSLEESAVPNTKTKKSNTFGNITFESKNYCNLMKTQSFDCLKSGSVIEKDYNSQKSMLLQNSLRPPSTNPISIFSNFKTPKSSTYFSNKSNRSYSDIGFSLETVCFISGLIMSHQKRQKINEQQSFKTTNQNVKIKALHNSIRNEKKFQISINSGNLNKYTVEQRFYCPSLINNLNYLRHTSFTHVSSKIQNCQISTRQKDQDSKKLLLVLDLDETLAHCSLEDLPQNPDLIVSFDDIESAGYVYFRPFLTLFMELASTICDICIFTASTKHYANQVIDAIDPLKKLIKHRLYRSNCTLVNGGYLKDLRKLSPSLNNVVLVDNSLVSFALQMDNAIPISSWFGDTQDIELMCLLLQLNNLVKEKDVRNYLVPYYGLREWVNSKRINELQKI